MNNDRKHNFNKKKSFNKKQDDQVNRITYTTKPSKIIRFFDWQLELMAISDCFELKDRENYDELVKARYQELKHKYK